MVADSDTMTASVMNWAVFDPAVERLLSPTGWERGQLEWEAAVLSGGSESVPGLDSKKWSEQHQPKTLHSPRRTRPYSFCLHTWIRAFSQPISGSGSRMD